MIHRRIELALKDAISYHNDGMLANDAIIKSASSHELNPETICRVVEAFNIAKTRAYVKRASIKDGEFETADKESVVRGVFGKDSKEEISTKKASDYFFEVRKKREEAQPSQEKFANFDLNKGLIDAAHSKKAEESDLEQLKLDISRLKHSFIEGVLKTASFFSYADNIDNADELLDKASFEYMENPIGQRVISLVSKVANLDYSAPDDLPPSEYGDSPIHETIDNLVYDAEEYQQKAAEYNKRVEEYTDGCSEMSSLSLKMAGIRTESSASSLMFGGKAKQAPKNTKIHKVATCLIDEAEEDLFTQPGDVPPVRLEKKASSFLKTSEISIPFNFAGADGKIPVVDMIGEMGSSKELSDKGYALRLMGERGMSEKDVVDAEMESVQRQALLRDIIANDEIVSTYDPQVTVDAYNTMVKLAPKASLMPDVVRSVLRYATAQTIDPHYASQLSELEANINKNTAGDPRDKKS